MRKLVYIAAPILIFVAGCGVSTSPQRSDSSAPRKRTARNPKRAVTSPSQAQPALAPIPLDVTYTIIHKDIIPDYKRSLDIRLNRKVSEDVLTSIAMKLKNSDPNSYKRTFIAYLLPDMKLNSGCWATTHFEPHLEVRILGFTAEAERDFRQRPLDPSREIIGRWVQETTGIASGVTIFRKDGRLFLERVYNDGSVGTDELVETPSPDGRRFEDVPDRGHGEYYLINSRGEFQMADPDGPWTTAKKVD